MVEMVRNCQPRRRLVMRDVLVLSSAMGRRKPHHTEYAPHCFAVRLAAEPGADRYLIPYLKRLRGGHYVMPYQRPHVPLSRRSGGCLPPRSLLPPAPADRHHGTDFPASPAAIGGDYYSVRIVIALEGGRDDPSNRLTNACLTRVTHTYAVEKDSLQASGRPVVRMHLPTLRDAVDLIRACPHLRLVADVMPTS